MTDHTSADASAVTELPAGFGCHVGNIGIKEGVDTPDVMILAADRPCVAAGVFTQSRFAGPSVLLSRRHLADGAAQAVVVVSKNANVATGAQGDADAAGLARRVAGAVGCEPSAVLVGSTGVIGVPYPPGRIDAYFDALAERAPAAGTAAFASRDATAAATAIMTTDTHPKTARATLSATGDGGGVANAAASIVGIAKGSGMIEPDMATMISVLATDAELAPDRLGAALRGVCEVTFNALSIDTDTSTSDMVVLLASGAAGPVDEAEFEAALGEVCLDLTRQLAFDGEGAETLITVTVTGARDTAQAKRVAKAIVNSPLVKTAVHGRDPNWGRVAMAIGKCSDESDIDPARVRICFGAQELYPSPATPQALAQLETYLASEEVLIRADLGIADGSFTAYGCDLTDQYVRINADYTT